jgi:hypothetical protein
MDKESLEKDRLKNRFGGKDGRATRTQDFSDTNHTHTTMHPEAQGYCPEAQRFICGGFDIAGEEKGMREKGMVHRHFQDSRRREASAVREENRWSQIDRAAKEDEERWHRYREHGGKAQRNKSSVPFHPITLKYNDGKDGTRLKQHDQVVKYRAGLRAQNLHRRNNAAGFNPVTGQDYPALVLPPNPHQ